MAKVDECNKDPAAENRRRLRELAAPGMRAVRDRFDEIIERLLAGESARHCCATMGLHREHLKRTVRNDPELQKRYVAALDASVPVRKRRLPEHMRKVWAGRRRQCEEIGAGVENVDPQHIEAVIALVEKGESLVAACRSNPDFPTKALMYEAMRRDPALRTRYLKASKHLRRRPAARLTEKRMTDITTSVASGSLLRDACAAAAINVAAFQFRALQRGWRDRWFKAKVDGAAARLRAGTLRDADGILVRIERGQSVRSAVAAAGVNVSAFRKAVRRFPEISQRFDLAVDANKRNRVRVSNIVRVHALAPADVRYRDDRLASEIWRRVRAVVPRHVNHDDIVSEIVVAVLAGELALDEITVENSQRFADRFSLTFESLDKSGGKDSTLRLIDTMTSDRWE